MKRLKVLMLGWEFPPLINGGLGIACHGMSKAIAKHVDLTLILPKSDLNFHVENVNVVGLNNLSTLSHKYKEYSLRTEDDKVVHISEDEYNHIVNSYKEFSNVKLVPNPGIDPYTQDFTLSFDEQEKYESYKKILSKTFKNTEKGNIYINEKITELGTFTLDKTYGDDVQSKVIEYATYVSSIAEHMDFDVIHAHDWMTMLAGLKTKALTGKPLVIHAHALSYDRGGPTARGWVFDLEKYGMQNADVVIPVSNYTAGIVVNHYEIDNSKVYPVHNGIDDVKANKSKKTIPEKIVLFLGRITEQKGPEYFLEIASKVIKKNPNVRFVMAGTGDKMKGLIESGAYMQVGDKFHFTGFLTRDRVNQLLGMADVYCMPSVSEPFGLSAVEAAQFGIPAVISKQSGVSEVLRSALKADFWDSELMASHILKLIENEAFAKEVVAKTFEDLKHISWDANAVKVIDIYQRTINKK